MACSLPRPDQEPTSSDPVEDMQPLPFLFLNLSPELRENVYDFYFADHEAENSMIDLREVQQKRPSLNLSLVSRQLYVETLPRWKAADETFLQRHRFFLHNALIPDARFLTHRTESSGSTLIGDFDSTNFEISNVTPVGKLIQRLHRLYIGYSLSDCRTTILVWEAVDAKNTQDTNHWKPKELGAFNDRINIMHSADAKFKRRTRQVAVVSEMDMLQGLTEFLIWEACDRCMIRCSFGRRYRQSTPDWSEEGDIFLLAGSRG